MTMTRQHFQLIADSLKYAKPSRTAKPRGFNDRMQAWTNTTLVFADNLALTNPLFDRDRFLAACDYEQ